MRVYGVRFRRRSHRRVYLSSRSFNSSAGKSSRRGSTAIGLYRPMHRKQYLTSADYSTSFIPNTYVRSLSYESFLRSNRSVPAAVQVFPSSRSTVVPARSAVTAFSSESLALARICHARRARRAVMHAAGFAGRSVRRPVYTQKSFIRCD